MMKSEYFYSKIGMCYATEIDDEMWLSNVLSNGIYKVNLKSYEANLVCRFNEELTAKFLYSDALKVCNKIVFVPHKAQSISVYDLETKRLNDYELVDLDTTSLNEDGSSKNMFWQGLVEDHYVFMFGYAYPAIIRFDVYSGEIRYITDWVKIVNKKIPKGDKRGYFAGGSFLKGNKIFIPFACILAFAVLDLVSLEVEIQYLSSCLDGSSGVRLIDDTKVAIVGRGNNTNKWILWDCVDDSIEIIDFQDTDEDLMDPFYPPLVVGQNLYFLPIAASHVYKYNLIDKTMEVCEEFDPIVNTSRKGQVFRMKTIGGRAYSKGISFISGYDLMWHDYNVNTKQIISYSVTCQAGIQELWKAEYENCRGHQRVMSETVLPLNEYIRRLTEVD